MGCGGGDENTEHSFLLWEKEHLLGKGHSQQTIPSVPDKGQRRPWLSQSLLLQKKPCLLSSLLPHHKKGDGSNDQLFCETLLKGNTLSS